MGRKVIDKQGWAASLVVNQPSRHAKGSDPMFKKVIPHDFRMHAGNHGNNTKSTRKVKNVWEAQLATITICENKHINGCRVTSGVQDVADSRTHRIAAVALRELWLRCHQWHVWPLRVRDSMNVPNLCAFGEARQCAVCQQRCTGNKREGIVTDTSDKSV